MIIEVDTTVTPLLERYMRRSSRSVVPLLAAAVLAAVAFVGITIPEAARAQSVSELGERGPHFYFASPGATTVTPLDTRRVAAFRRRVSLDVENVPLATVLDAIARQAGLRVEYSPSLPQLNAPVSLHARDLTVVSALTEVLLDAAMDVVLMPSGKLSVRRHIERQDGSVAGAVTDAKTGEPLRAVTVQLEGTSLGATTDERGHYRIGQVPPGSYTLVARRLGYAPAKHVVTVTADHESTANLALQKAATALDQVVVTGTIVPTAVKALPTPVSVVSDSQIAQRHPITLIDVLRQAIPTAVAFNAPNAPTNTGVSVRGTTSLIRTGEMKVFIDGVEISRFDTSPIDPNSIGRIEVIRGPEAATIYGADAATGVMQIFTKRGIGVATRPRVDAQAALGLAQTPYAGYRGVLRQQYTGSVHGGEPEMGYNFGGSYTHLADYVPENGRTRQATASVYGGMHMARKSFTADLFARHHNMKVPTALNPLIRHIDYIPESRPDYTLATQTNETYGTRLTATPTHWWRNQLTMGVDRSRLNTTQTQRRLTTPNDTLLEILDYATRKLSAGFNTSLTGTVSTAMTGTLTLGVDHYAQELIQFHTNRALNTDGTITTAPPGTPNELISTVTNTGYFAQAQLGVHEALFLTAGARAEDNSTFGSDVGLTVLPRFGASFVRPVGATTVKIRASYGKALRTPSAGEAAGSSSPTSIKLANPDLVPEEQRGWDAGIDLVFGARGSLSVTGYDQTATDLIALLQVGAVPAPTYQYRNVGRASNKGLEVEGTVALAWGAQLKAQYGYVRSRIEDAGTAGGSVQAGDVPVLIPAHTAGASFTVTPRTGTTVTVGMTYVGDYREYDTLAELRCLGSLSADVCPAEFLSTFSLRDFLKTYPGFAKFNATVSHRFGQHVEGFLSVDNLTNNEAYEFYNASVVMGRVTTVGLHFTY
jgi:outer membrane receptor protein involved in Fe transport